MTEAAAAAGTARGSGAGAGGGAGPLLRGRRKRLRISQLELALRADSSARHISFVGNGRSRPSQDMVLRLAEHLDVPLRERNALLLAAGYAPGFPETPPDAPAMDALRDVLRARRPGSGTHTLPAAPRERRLPTR
jgi:transcriptional regulator with XRE-family HTH domain